MEILIKDFFENLVKDLGNIKLINLNIDNFVPFPYAYNKFLTNKNFYNLIRKGNLFNYTIRCSFI